MTNALQHSTELELQPQAMNQSRSGLQTKKLAESFHHPNSNPCRANGGVK